MTAIRAWATFDLAADPEEWERMWAAVEDVYGSRACYDAESGETWQYLGSELWDRPEGAARLQGVRSDWHHVFRHRRLFAGGRTHFILPASEGWTPPTDTLSL